MSEETIMFDGKEPVPAPSPLNEPFSSEGNASESDPKPKRVNRVSKKKADMAAAADEVTQKVFILSPEERTLDRFFLSLQSEDMPDSVPDFSQGINFQTPYKTLEIINKDIAHLRETAFVTLACNAGLEAKNKILQIEKIYTVLDEEVSARSFLVEQQNQHLKDYYSRLGGLILGTQEASEVLSADLKGEQKYRHLMESGLFYAPEIWQKFIDEGADAVTTAVTPSPMQILEQQPLLEPAAPAELPLALIELLNGNTTLLSEQAIAISLLKEQIETLAAGFHQFQTERPVSVSSPATLAAAPPSVSPVEPPEEEFPDEFEEESPPPAFSGAENPMFKLMQQLENAEKPSNENLSPVNRAVAPVAGASDDDAV